MGLKGFLSGICYTDRQALSRSLLLLRFISMSSTASDTVNATIVKYPEWQAIANTVMMACLIIFFIAAIAVTLMKRQNVPVTQAIEVDSREPHSITITFIPAQVMMEKPVSGQPRNGPVDVAAGVPTATNTSEAEVLPPAAPIA